MTFGHRSDLKKIMPQLLSIIIPARNEANCIESSLHHLQPLRQAGHEVIVADGGSEDATLALAAPLADMALSVPPGRARQMNAGAARAGHGVLVFLHADTGLPETAAADIAAVLAGGYEWGRFDVSIMPTDPLLGVVATMINLRSRVTGVATGDQAIFVRRRLFETVGGYPDIRLMEDLALSDRLRRQAGRPACLRSRVTTSARRWQQHGRLKTIMKMWYLRLAYRLGADPEQLARHYD